MRKLAQALAASVAVITGAGAAHADTTWSVATGLDFSSGDYGGAEDTEVTSIPLTLRVVNGNWVFRASTSYLSVTGPADVADADDGGGGGGGVTTRIGTERGMGDTNLSVAHTWRDLGGSDAYFETTARVRLPTGDEDKGLGVGATDYGLAGEIGVSGSGGGASLGLTRRFLGDRTGVDRQDGWQVNASAWLRPQPRTTLGVFGYWREASIDGRDDPAQAGVFASHRITPEVRLSANLAGGLSDASADYTAGFRLTWRPTDDD